MIERHLSYFLVVAEEQHFQRAAKRLNIAQSALSRRIHLLEQELKVQLFERLPRGVRLSPAGERFYADMRSVQQELITARQRLTEIGRGDIIRTRIAVNPSSPSCPTVAAMFARLRAEWPNVEINLQIIFSERQPTHLRSKEIDIGVMYQLSREEDDLRYRTIATESFYLAMPRDHPLARRDRLYAADLTNVPFIWPDRSNSPLLFDTMIVACNAKGLSPRIATEVRAAGPIMRIVSISNSVCFVSKYQIDEAPRSVVVRPIEDLSICFPIVLVWRADDPPPALDAFLNSAAAPAGDPE